MCASVGGDHQLRRSVCAAGQPACPQVSRSTGLSGSDRDFPALTGRSGTQRARAYFGEHLIRRLRQVLQGRLMPSVRWANIPQLSTLDRRCPAAWQQYWQQSRPNSTDPRPSANEAGHIPSWHRSCERYAPSSVVAGSRWLLLLLSVVDRGDHVAAVVCGADSIR